MRDGSIHSEMSVSIAHLTLCGSQCSSWCLNLDFVVTVCAAFNTDVQQTISAVHTFVQYKTSSCQNPLASASGQTATALPGVTRQQDRVNLQLTSASITLAPIASHGVPPSSPQAEYHLPTALLTCKGTIYLHTHALCWCISMCSSL